MIGKKLEIILLILLHLNKKEKYKNSFIVKIGKIKQQKVDQMIDFFVIIKSNKGGLK